MDKLDYKKIRLFKIKEKIREVYYRLKLLEYIRINLVFYVALLELIPYNTPVIILNFLDKNKIIEYKVEDIIN